MTLTPSDTILLSAPIDFFAATKRYIMGRTTPTTYSSTDVDYILTLYKEACITGGVDPELGLSQMVHETAALTSDWSQLPKRNPAGIGVTGAVGTDGQPVGQIFPSWLDGVQCHVGLLLCYRFPAGSGNTQQQRLINLCLSYRPGAPRGVATTVTEMAAKWAADPAYADKLSAMSVAISKS